jgi:hypothetical protein
MSSIIDIFNMQFPLEAESLEKENQNLLHTSDDDTLEEELDRVYHDSITLVCFRYSRYPRRIIC